jgi:hypothetical protein
MTLDELLMLIRGQGSPTGMKMAPAMKPYPDAALMPGGAPLQLRMAPGLGTAEGGLRLPTISPELKAWAEENARRAEEARQARLLRERGGALTAPPMPGLLSGSRG